MTTVISPNPPESAPVEVVIVDDEDLTLEIVSWILRSSKVSHRLFTDPEVALAYLSNSLPRTLIVDYYMPMMNGIDFIRRLKSVSDLSACSLFLCSAIKPGEDQLAHLQSLDATTLDKASICDRSALLRLVETEQQLTGN